MRFDVCSNMSGNNELRGARKVVSVTNLQLVCRNIFIKLAIFKCERLFSPAVGYRAVIANANVLSLVALAADERAHAIPKCKT